jgi:competence protein ComGF
MKKYITTLVLVVLFLGLLVFFYLYEANKKDKDESADTLAAKTFNVWEINTDEVKLISIKHSDVEIELAKQEDSTWKITKPKEEKADLEKVNSILDEYKTVEGKGEKITAANLAEFNLEKPKGTVKFKFKDDSEKEINFGDNSIDEVNIYAKTSDNGDVFLTDKYLYDKIKVKADDLKEKKEEPKTEEKK